MSGSPHKLRHSIKTVRLCALSYDAVQHQLGGVIAQVVISYCNTNISGIRLSAPSTANRATSQTIGLMLDVFCDGSYNGLPSRSSPAPVA